MIKLNIILLIYFSYKSNGYAKIETLDKMKAYNIDLIRVVKKLGKFTNNEISLFCVENARTESANPLPYFKEGNEEKVK